jgi:DnaJ-class molecular chaperone
MTDFYQILGVSETATPEEIKKAYRKLANQHHPDKGGDQNKFKDISVAYDTLGDPQKKAEYDQQRSGGFQQFQFNTGNGGFQNFHDIFGQHFDPFGHRSNPFADFARQRGRNKDLNIRCQITLMDSFVGKQLEASYTLPSGKTQTVHINVPAGVQAGDTIRYAGLGDDSLVGMPRGSLNVTINIIPDKQFERRGDDLYTVLELTPIEAMIGCRKTVPTITGQSIDLEVRAGVETGVEFANAGGGFNNINTGRKGRFVTVIKLKSVAITDPSIIEQLKKINNEISK